MLKAGIFPVFSFLHQQKTGLRPVFMRERCLVGGFRFVLRCALEVVGQRVFRAVQGNRHLTTIDQRAKQQLVRQRFFRLS